MPDILPSHRAELDTPRWLTTLHFMHTTTSNSNNGCRFFSAPSSTAKPAFEPVHNSLQHILKFVSEAYPNDLAWLHSQDAIIFAPSSRTTMSKEAHCFHWFILGSRPGCDTIHSSSCSYDYSGNWYSGALEIYFLSSLHLHSDQRQPLFLA